MRFQRSLCVFYILMVFAIFPGARAGWCDNTPAEPISIVADRMESHQKDRAVSFSGNVEATQGDLTIKADNMTIYYLAADPQNSQNKHVSENIEKLTAQGHVGLIKQGWTASGDSVDYLARTRKIILTGNTKVIRDNNTITGERIILDLDDGKSIVECDPQSGDRVKAIINPEALDHDKSTKVE